MKAHLKDDAELLDILDHLEADSWSSILKIQAQGQKYGKTFEAKRQAFRKCQKAAYDSKLQADTHLKAAFSRLKPPQASPLIFATRTSPGPQAQPAGTIATHPQEVDDIAIQAGEKIYDGNVGCTQSLLSNFFRKYRSYIPSLADHLPYVTTNTKGPNKHYATSNITGEQLYEVLKRMHPSAQGLDHIFTADLRMLNSSALQWLADMYNIIEEGAPWPDPCLQVRTAYLTKPGGDPFNPSDYRNLSITSVTYRLWATTRLRDISQWAQSWKLDGIFAGLPGVGAEDAWYTTAVTLELAKLTNTPFLGAAADIWKCFDQICRPLLFAILWTMGIPIGLLQAYQAFLDNLVFINSLAGGLGRPHRRACGIPQGCPLSMLFIAAMFRPWLMLMNTIGIVGRILADDVMIIGFGNQGHQVFQDAYDNTHEYFADIGAKVSTKKCYTYASHADTRRWLADHTWKHLKDKVQVVLHVRDLGGHLNTTLGPLATTLTERLKQAAQYAQRIRFLNIGDNGKHRLITAKILALGLYGCEAAPTNQSALRHLQNTISAIISGHSARTSSAITFTTQATARDLDPCIHVFTRRGVMLRRMYYKHPHLQDTIHYIHSIYLEHAYQGTDTSPMKIASLWPAPPPLSPHSKFWNPIFRPCGPVGLFIASCHKNAVAVDQAFDIHGHGEIPVSLLQLPQQCVVPKLDAIAIRARTLAATSVRRTFGILNEVDQRVMTAATAGLSPEHRRVTRH